MAISTLLRVGRRAARAALPALALLVGGAGRADAQLYVAGLSNGIYRYDATTGAFLDSFGGNGGDLFQAPLGLAFGADGNLYASRFTLNRVERYAPDGTSLGVFATGIDAAIGLTFGPDGDLFVAARNTDNVLRFDGATGAPLGAFVTSGSGGLDDPEAVVFGPDGNLYVGGFFADAVRRYDGTTGAFLGTFTVGGPLAGSRGIVFTADGTRMLVASTMTNEVLAYDATTGAYLGVFAAGGGLSSPNGITFGPGGDLYVSSEGTSQVLRYDGATGAFVEVFASGGGLASPIGLVFAPTQVVPEPTTLVLLATGVGVVLVGARRRAGGVRA